jgi:transcriptional regulator with XRE-family HTH domain
VADVVGDTAGSPPFEPVGQQLARLRHQRAVTGHELGRRVRMSQAKISKIETGAVQPNPADVRRIAEELGAPPAEVERLTRLAAEPADDAGADREASWQREMAQMEAAATVIRNFQPVLLSGLLQTSEFARAMFHVFKEPSPAPANGGGILAAVSARVRRQEILADPGRRFHFVMPQTMLISQLAPADEMPAQLSRIREVARQHNVTVSLVPDGAQWPVPPLHGFTILDDEHVVIDTLTSNVVLTDRSEIRRYRQYFASFEEIASTDIDPVLDRFRRIYLQRAQES